MNRAVIAEDELLLRDALSRLLGDAWPELEVIAECENGAEALDAIAAQRPDVAFLDIRMPGLSGLEVAAAAAEASPATQVVFMYFYRKRWKDVPRPQTGPMPKPSGDAGPLAPTRP